MSNTLVATRAAAIAALRSSTRAILIGSLAAAFSVGTAGEAAGDLPPIERRAEQLFEMLRGDDVEALGRFLEEALHPSFFEMGPLEMHVEQFGHIRQALGEFEIDGVRIEGPDRGEFVLRNPQGETYSLRVEVEPIEPHRLAGIGLQPYKPIRDVPDYGSLEEVDGHLRRLAEANEFSGTILVTREGEPPWSHAYGMANKERGIANTVDTGYDIGSITKTFTGLAVLQLVEQGKLDLEAPMSRYLEGFPAEIADRVRVIDLLRMESGYGDYFSPRFERKREQLLEVSDYLELFKTFELEFEPGTKQRYSNAGYVLLGGIVESVSGMLYRDYVERQIFEPAGMASSSFRNLEADRPGIAVGYTNDGPSGKRGYVETNRSIMEIRGTPAGGSVSTAGDLLRFNRALRGNRLLGDALTTFLLNGYEERADRSRVRGTAGGAPGVSAVNLEDAGAGVTVIILSNYDEPLAEQIGEQVFAMLRRDAPGAAAPPRAAAVPMRILGDQPAVEVTIDGEGPFLFLVDTGAADHGSISPELAERFGMEKVGQVIAGDPSGRNRETRDLVRVGELGLGGRLWRGLDMLLAGDGQADPGIDGILGFELFRDVLLTLDYPGGELRFEPGELPAADGDEVLEFRADHGIPMIDLDVAGTRVAADLDSGSMGWLMVPESVARELPLEGPERVVGRARTEFNEFEIKAAPLDGAIRVGRHSLERPMLEFADVFPHGNVGGQFLKLFTVTFDQRNGRVRFAREEAMPLIREPRYRVGLMLAQGPEVLTIEGTMPDSPAESAGLLAGDRVLRINGTATADLPAGEMGRVFGRPEEIVLLVDRGGEQIEVRLTPARAD